MKKKVLKIRVNNGSYGSDKVWSLGWAKKMYRVHERKKSQKSADKGCRIVGESRMIFIFVLSDIEIVMKNKISENNSWKNNWKKIFFSGK